MRITRNCVLRPGIGLGVPTGRSVAEGRGFLRCIDHEIAKKENSLKELRPLFFFIQQHPKTTGPKFDLYRIAKCCCNFQNWHKNDGKKEAGQMMSTVSNPTSQRENTSAS